MDYTKYTDSIKLPIEKLELAIIPEKNLHVFFSSRQQEAYANAIEYLEYYRIITEKHPMNQNVYKYFLFGLSEMFERVFLDEYNGLASINVGNLNKFFDEKDIQFHIDVNYDVPFNPTFKVIRWLTWKEFI